MKPSNLLLIETFPETKTFSRSVIYWQSLTSISQFQNVSVEVDPFVPTSQDLAGFWDMVSIQVDQIHDRFSQLADLRKADWIVKVKFIFLSSQNQFNCTEIEQALPTVVPNF